jgi:hypothetical protein
MTTRTKYTIEDAQKLAQNNGGRCLSQKYINNKFYLDWMCEKGHTWGSSFKNIKEGSWCAECSRIKRRKYSIEDMQKLAQKYGGECLSNDYINSKSKLIWKCEKGHVFESTYYNIQKNGLCCRTCKNGGSWFIIGRFSKINDYAKKNGIFLLSEYKKSSKNTYKWFCGNCGKTLTKTFDQIKRSGCGFCHCGKKKNQKKTLNERYSNVYDTVKMRGKYIQSANKNEIDSKKAWKLVCYLPIKDEYENFVKKLKLEKKIANRGLKVMEDIIKQSRRVNKFLVPNSIISLTLYLITKFTIKDICRIFGWKEGGNIGVIFRKLGFSNKRISDYRVELHKKHVW